MCPQIEDIPLYQPDGSTRYLLDWPVGNLELNEHKHQNPKGREIISSLDRVVVHRDVYEGGQMLGQNLNYLLKGTVNHS